MRTPRRLFDQNRRGVVDFSKAPRRFPGPNRRGSGLRDVGGLTDVIFNVSWVNVGSGSDDKSLS